MSDSNLNYRNVIASELSVGDALPEFELPITAKLVVSTAMASQDFQDVHHDKDAAIAKGTPDIFMNILTTNGFVGRYLTDWAGPGSRIKKIQFNLGAPNYPGDTMIMSGEVTELSQDGDHHLAHVNFKGKNGMGNHVSGVAVVQLAKAAG